MKKTLLLSISLFNLFFVSAQTTSLQWAKSMGGNEQDILNAMATDASGALIMTGSFKGTADFDPGPGVANLTSSNFDDIFISKLDASGNFLWAKQIGAALGDFGRSITTDKSGNIYVTGSFQGTADFDPGAGIVNLISYGASDVFVLKLNTSGNLIWARRMGGAADQQGYAIAVDSSGNVYTGGSFRETSDFDPGVGTSNYTSVGSSDIFFSKLDSSGNFVWAERFGGVNYDDLYSIALDNTGALYSTGSFQGLAFNLVSAGQDDIFISKLNANGKFVYVTLLV